MKECRATTLELPLHTLHLDMKLRGDRVTNFCKNKTVCAEPLYGISLLTNFGSGFFKIPFLGNLEKLLDLSKQFPISMRFKRT